MGFLGAGAVIGTGVLLTRTRLADFIRYCGENSIVIYLAFFLFMAAARSALLKLGFITDLGIISLIVTAAGVVGPVVLFRAVRGTRLNFLFNRPRWVRLAATPEQRIAFATGRS
jgi:uncharacterized membrane protein YcfT